MNKNMHCDSKMLSTKTFKVMCDGLLLKYDGQNLVHGL